MMTVGGRLDCLLKRVPTVAIYVSARTEWATYYQRNAYLWDRLPFNMHVQACQAVLFALLCFGVASVSAQDCFALMEEASCQSPCIWTEFCQYPPACGSAFSAEDCSNANITGREDCVYNENSVAGTNCDAPGVTVSRIIPACEGATECEACHVLGADTIMACALVEATSVHSLASHSLAFHCFLDATPSTPCDELSRSDCPQRRCTLEGFTCRSKKCSDVFESTDCQGLDTSCIYDTELFICYNKTGWCTLLSSQAV
jgi:hypothetical protein